MANHHHHQQPLAVNSLAVVTFATHAQIHRRSDDSKHQIRKKDGCGITTTIEGVPVYDGGNILVRKRFTPKIASQYVVVCIISTDKIKHRTGDDEMMCCLRCNRERQSLKEKV